MKENLEVCFAIALSMALLNAPVTYGNEVEETAPVPNFGELTFDGDVIEIKLSQEDLQPKVTVDLGDGELHLFIVDTGASVNVIDSSLAEAHQFEVLGEMDIGAPGGLTVNGNIVRAPVAKMGAATIRNAEFVAMDIMDLSTGTTQGVIGMGQFGEYLLTFDQSRGVLVVSRETLRPESPGVIPYIDISGHIQLDVEFAGETIRSHFDTGASTEFTLPAELMNSLPLQNISDTSVPARMVGGEREITFAQLDGKVVFSGFEFENPNIAFMKPSPVYGNIGNGVLSTMLVSIDQKNQLMLLKKPLHTNGTIMKAKPRQLGMMFKGVGDSELSIASVIPGSLAETAGLRFGDILIKVNGRAARDYEMAEFGILFRGSDTLIFIIERDGKTKTITIE